MEALEKCILMVLFVSFLKEVHFVAFFKICLEKKHGSENVNRALKLGCITNVNMLFLTMGFICLFYENKFMLISGGHISNRSNCMVEVQCLQCMCRAMTVPA